MQIAQNRILPDYFQDALNY